LFPWLAARGAGRPKTLNRRKKLSKIIEVTVTIEMSVDIPKEQSVNIVENTLEALVNHVEGSEQGLSGDNFEGFTTHITVEHDKFSKAWRPFPIKKENK
jgi:hypothetical protein